jgi:hypothetical protein
MPNFIEKFLDYYINPIGYGKASVKPLERPRNEKPLLSDSTRKPKQERLRLEDLLSQVNAREAYA